MLFILGLERHSAVTEFMKRYRWFVHLPVENWNCYISTVIKRYFIVLFILFLTLVAKAQHQHIIDSVKSLIDEAPHLPDGQAGDTTVCDAYLIWGERIYLNQPDTALLLWQKAYDICTGNLAVGHPVAIENTFSTLLSEALNNMGHIYQNQGKIAKGLEFQLRSLKISEELGNKKSAASSLSNIGLVYHIQGDIAKGLEYFHKSLAINEEINDKSGMSTCLNNIGAIYYYQGNITQALKYYFKSLKIREEAGDKHGVAISLNNIGALYNGEGDFVRALEYHLKSLKIKEENGYKSGMATSMNNIGLIYTKHGDVAKGLKYYQSSLKIREEIGDKEGAAISINNMGVIYLDKGDIKTAKAYAQKSMDLASELGIPEVIKRSAALFSDLYKEEGDYKNSLEMYELEIQMRDSMKNEETEKATIRQQTKYEFEKAQLITEQHEKDAGRKMQEVRNRRDNLQYSVILIAILALFAGVLGLGFINVSERTAEGIIFFSFLILFEFLLVLADPYIDNWSGGAPGIKLLFNAGIAALIFPAHAFFEGRLKGRLVKKVL